MANAKDFIDITEALPRGVPASAGPDVRNLDNFTKSYLYAALWNEELDGDYGVDRIAPSSVESVRVDCEKFQAENAEDLAHFYSVMERGDGDDEGTGGYCLYMDRVGAGVGFWDRTDDPVGDRLSEAAKALGYAATPIVGDDGQIYFE